MLFKKYYNYKKKKFIEKINIMNNFIEDVKLYLNNKYDFIFICIFYYLKNNLNKKYKINI